MAVDHQATAEAEVVGDIARAFPVEEGLLDGVAVGVLADAAARRVMAEAYVFRAALPAGFGPVKAPSVVERARSATHRTREGWGTRKFFFALLCLALLRCDGDWEFNTRFGKVFVFDFRWGGEAGIVHHFVHVARFKLNCLAGRLRVRLRRDNLLYFDDFVDWSVGSFDSLRSFRRDFLFPLSDLDDLFWRDRGLRWRWFARRNWAWIGEGCIGAKGPLWCAGQDPNVAARHRGSWRRRRGFAGCPGAAAFSLPRRAVVDNVSHKRKGLYNTVLVICQ